jgi:type IV secretion system protein VirD4
MILRRGKNCKPVLFMADELAYTKIPDLHLHAATVVGRGISLWMAIQDPSQLIATYGFENAQTILANCDAHLRYRPVLFQSAKDISEWLGYRSEFAHSKSTHHGEEFSEGEAETAVHNMTAQEVKGQDDEDIFIEYRNKRPIQAKRIDIRNYPKILAMTKIPPPLLLPIPDIPNTMGQENREGKMGYISPDMH